MKKYLSCLSIVALMLSLSFCSDDNLAFFQNNDPKPEYSLFDILDDYPALKSAFDPIDQRRFNDLLGKAVNNNVREMKDVLTVVDDLLSDPGRPVTDSISSLRNTIHQVINQNEADIDPLFNSRNSPADYAGGLYNLWDKISEKDITISKNIISILRKVVAYIKNTFSKEEIEEIMTDLIAFIKDNEAYLWRDNENNLFEDIAKIFFQGNENIWLDNNGNVITNRDKINDNGVTDLKIGNSASGMDSLLSGINGLLRDDALREDLYKILREAGDLFASEVQGKKLKDIIRDFVANVQKYLNPGGEEYERWEDYIYPDFNPYSGYSNRDGEKVDNKGRIFCDSTMAKTIYELFPAIQTLLLRSDRIGSHLYDKDGDKTYFLEIIARNSRKIDATPDNPECTYSHIEEAIYDHIRFDYSAKDRLSVDSYDPDNYDPRIEPNPSSNLESILFFAASAMTMGWKDENLNTGEYVNCPNATHGNVKPSGILSLCNILAGMGTNFLLKIDGLMDGVNLFDIAFTDKSKDHVFRSVNYFDLSERDQYRFSIDANYNLLGFLSGPIVSDAGIPTGGRNPYDEKGEPILNGYMGYNGRGLGNSDFAGFLFGFIVRDLMLGEGPYYTTIRHKKEGNVYTYFRANGSIYAKIIKPDVNDAKTWDYIYPADDPYDTPAPALFVSDIDLITDGGVYLDSGCEVEITIDDETFNVVFEPGLVNQKLVIDLLNSKIRDAFGYEDIRLVVPGGKGFSIKGQNTTPPEGKIIIKDVAGNAIDKLFRDGFNKRFKKVRNDIVEYAGRENRYRRRWLSDYFMVEYTPFGGSNSIFINPANTSGTAREPGNLLATELIPEHTVARECYTHEEAIGRNFEWCYTEMMFGLPVTLYASIGGDVIEKIINEVLRGLLGDYLDDRILGPIINNSINEILELLPNELFALPITLSIEGNGLSALLAMKFPHRGSSEYPIMGRWVKDGGFGKSYIPGDFRMSLIFPDKLLADTLTVPINNLLNRINAIPLVNLGFDSIDDIIDDIINAVLYGGSIMGILPVEPLINHGMPIAPAMMCNAQSLGHIVFPRSLTQQIYSREENNSVYTNEEDLLFGSRKGELLYDEEGNYHPEWGLEVSDYDDNWMRRNGVGLIYMVLLEAFREHTCSDLSLYDPNIPGSAITHNGISLHLNDLFAPLVMPPLCYFEHGGEGNPYPENAWKTHIVGGQLRSDHHLGPDYFTPGDPPTSDYFLTNTDDIAASGVNKETGEPLEPNDNIIFGGWALKNYFRSKDIRNLINILIDSDPYAAEPKRCDGLLPLLTAYDVTKYSTMDHSKEPNSRLISGILRLLYTLGDVKYDDPPGVDYDDPSTWGLRRDICYGLEQFITTIKAPKGFQKAQNETNYKRIVRPKWMYSEDDDGNPFPLRPEDIVLNVAEFPSPPEYPDWDNFNRLMDALGELLSDNGETGGKYNIMNDAIAIIEKIFTKVEASNDNIRGLRHTLGAALTRYNKADSGWEYPDDLVHVLEKELPEILENFEGHYSNLLVLADALLKSNGNDDGFLAYVMKNLKSAYPTQDVVEQLYDFLGIDIVARPDSALWSDLTELIISFVEMIDDEEQPEWLENDTFHSNRAVEEMDTFGALGELLSW